MIGILSGLSSFAQVADTAVVENKKDTTRITIGNKEIQITESGKEKKAEMKSWKGGGFKGHWSGVEIGLNNYLNSDHKMSLSPSDNFMSLNTNKSINVNVNIAQKSIGLIGNSFGMVTGIGLEFFNYVFEKNITLDVDPNGNIVPKPLDFDAQKSKLTFSYLTVPVIFEFQFPGGLSHSKRLHISAGVIGGLKLGSHTKVTYNENGRKYKDKNHDDFNINSFKYGLTARIGYRQLGFYANYYPVSLFEDGKTPVLYPYSVGIAFTFE
jgi:hypothetical protein